MNIISLVIGFIVGLIFFIIKDVIFNREVFNNMHKNKLMFKMVACVIYAVIALGALVLIIQGM